MSSFSDSDLDLLITKFGEGAIKVFGCGGGGNNTLNRISEIGILGVSTIAVNTDAQDLRACNADYKLLIGKNSSRGLGAGGNPSVGARCARENMTEINELLTDAKLVFITCGLGGGTGTGSSSVIAKAAKQEGALVIAIVTLPFKMEKSNRFNVAIEGMRELETYVDTMIVIPNDKLLSLAPDLPLNVAFKVADEVLTNAVKGIAELLTKKGLVNLDFADLKSVMGQGGVSLISIGEGEGDDMPLSAVNNALSNPLIDVDIDGATGALINVVGGDNLTLSDAEDAVNQITSKLDDDAKVIWGAQIDEDMGDMIRIILVVTGVTSSQIVGEFSKKNRDKQFKDDLGIDYV